MAIGGMCHAAANLLDTDDVFTNTMPMFHIAGLMENLLASAFSGSRFIALPGIYQPHTFYENIIKEPYATCYSVVPRGDGDDAGAPKGCDREAREDKPLCEVGPGSPYG